MRGGALSIKIIRRSVIRNTGPSLRQCFPKHILPPETGLNSQVIRRKCATGYGTMFRIIDNRQVPVDNPLRFHSRCNSIRVRTREHLCWPGRGRPASGGGSELSFSTKGTTSCGKNMAKGCGRLLPGGYWIPRRRADRHRKWLGGRGASRAGTLARSPGVVRRGP